MKTYPITRADGFLYAFEIGNGLISMGTIKRVLREKGATRLKRQFMSDDRLTFWWGGEEWVVNEPYGDNSRYWIGPKSAANHRLDVAPIQDAFIAYRAPVMRLWFAIRKAMSR